MQFFQTPPRFSDGEKKFYYQIKIDTNMSTYGSSTNPPTYGTNPKPDGSKQQLTIIAAAIVVALLGVIVVMWISSNNKKTELTEKLDTSEQLKAEAEQQYQTALAELEQMRGSNEELNALIEQQKAELTTQKEKIDGLLATKGSLDKARKEIGSMKTQIQQYLAEVNQLREQNQELTTQNMTLSEEKVRLSTDLEMERTNAASLSNEKAMLVSEKEAIETEKAKLSKKVTAASVVKVSEIEVSGLKMKDSGKAVKKSYAKNVDQLKICFNTTVNEVADPGSDLYHIRVIDPQGITLAVESLGSGVFVSNAGEEIKFTTTKEFDYNQDANTLCTTWSSGQELARGNYQIELYNKGYLAGKSTFKLK